MQCQVYYYNLCLLITEKIRQKKMEGKKGILQKMNIQFKSKMKAGILSFYGMNIAKENASAETTLE